MDIAIIVGKAALACVSHDSGSYTERPDEATPMYFRAWDILIEESDADSHIDTEEPYVGCEAVEHTSHEGCLARHACQLSVDRVAEIGEEQEYHAVDIMLQVGMEKHPAGCCAEKEREDGDGIRMNA